MKYQHDFIGIDGEGIGRKPHRYVLLAAATENGTTWYAENLKGLTTKQCLDFILGLPHARIFSFSFGYDLTKILQDLDNHTLYLLFRPSKRYRKTNRARGPRSVKWKGYQLNWLNGRFNVSRGNRTKTIWDLYKFYQMTFVSALEKWQVGDSEYIQSMKERRGRFRFSELDAIRKYCFTECMYLAKLAKRLIQTHVKVGLKLRSYFGPGSTAGIALGRMGIRDSRGVHPSAMREPIACAFFGGRFEHSIMGPVEQEVYGYDISSAYPYHLFQLPCLACGKWRYTTKSNDLRQCTTALVHYGYRGSPRLSWAPFPWRDRRGTIYYPYRGEGWAWMNEYNAAQRYFSGVKFLGAWIYTTKCDCRPFEVVAQFYRDRVNLGKDAAGIVLKLAINSIYGKLAQSTGLNPAFQCWIWAGMVTAGTRAQILDLMHCTTSRTDVLAIATDGVYTRRRINCPSPIDTGTYDLSKPLGGWEEKLYPEGMFFVKPGIYFPLKDDIEPDYLRARGIGRRALLENKNRIMSAYRRGMHVVKLPKIERFHGAKTCISRTLNRSKRFGEWTKVPIELQFECPNRNPDMSLRKADGISHPYSKGMIGPEKLQALIDEAIDYEQPK